MQSVEEILLDYGRAVPDLESTAFGPMLRAVQFAALVRRFEERVLEPFEVGPSEFEALSQLRREGPPFKLNPKRLATRASISSGGLTKMLGRLERQGLVEREPDPEDGRGRRVVLTRRGLDLQSRILRAFVAAAENRLDGLDDVARSEYDQALALWSEALDR